MTKEQILQVIRDYEEELYADLQLRKETDRILEREAPGNSTTHARAAWASVWRLRQAIEVRIKP